MSKKQKYYVVWQGNQPGIYSSWADCEKQTKGVAGAKYKSFESLVLAEQAFRLGPEMGMSVVERQTVGEPLLSVDDMGMTYVRPDFEGPKPLLDSVAVDAACSGNPGVMEYQGVYVASRTQLFHYKAPVGTNNIGEFLAIVHGLAYLKQHKMSQVLYTDSATAFGWVRAKQCRTKLALTPETEPLYAVIRRAEAWLCNNRYDTQILKWDTDRWGEIPADFGRK